MSIFFVYTLTYVQIIQFSMGRVYILKAVQFQTIQFSIENSSISNHSVQYKYAV